MKDAEYVTSMVRGNCPFDEIVEDAGFIYLYILRDLTEAERAHPVLANPSNLRTLKLVLSIHTLHSIVIKELP